MKFLITGAAGQLGNQINQELRLIGVDDHDILAADKKSLDVRYYDQVKKVVDVFQPDVIFHCAAFTDVEASEKIKRDLAYEVNLGGTKNIVNAIKDTNIKLVFISTDYVFDGKSQDLYEIDSHKNPLNVYGLTKSLAEDIVLEYKRSFIVRTAWIFGGSGHNFIEKMVELSKDHNKVYVVCDQIGSPTYAPHLASMLIKLALSDKYGIYHITNEGFISRSDLVRLAYKYLNIDTKVSDILTSSLQSSASRPLNACLSKQSLLDNNFELLAHYEQAVEEYCKKLKRR